MAMKYHPIYSKDATVYLATGENKLDAMQRAMELSSFFENVEAVLEGSGKTRAEHGITDFLVKDAAGELRPVTSRGVRCPRLWDICSAGGRLGVIYLLAGRPPALVAIDLEKGK